LVVREVAPHAVEDPEHDVPDPLALNPGQRAAELRSSRGVLAGLVDLDDVHQLEAFGRGETDNPTPLDVRGTAVRLLCRRDANDPERGRGTSCAARLAAHDAP